MTPATRTLLTLSLAALAYALQQTMIVPAIPTFAEELGVSSASATWLLTAFLVTTAVSTPALGRLGDMFGKHRMLLVSLGIFALGSLVAALGHTFAVVLAGRIIQGGGGAIVPLSIGIARDELPRERVAVGIGVISAMFGIGGGAGLVLAGVLIEHAGVEWLFWSGLIVTAVAALAVVLWIPASRVRVRARIDVAGALLLALAVGCFLLGVTQASDWGVTSGRVLGLFALALVSGVAWLWWERRVEEPMVDLALMATRPVWTTNVVAATIGFAMFGSYVLIPALASTPRVAGYGFGTSVLGAGLLMLPSAITMLIGAPLAGRMARGAGSQAALALGCLLVAVATFWIALLHDTEWQVSFGGAVMGLGMGLALAAMAILVLQSVPPEQSGIASGLNVIVRYIGGAMGAQLAAAVVASHTVLGGRFPAVSGYEAAFAMSGVAALLALAAASRIPRRPTAAAVVSPQAAA